eukprot:1157382-Pelagomonas_calceolata.AAC.2
MCVCQCRAALWCAAQPDTKLELAMLHAQIEEKEHIRTASLEDYRPPWSSKQAMQGSSAHIQVTEWKSHEAQGSAGSTRKWLKTMLKGEQTATVLMQVIGCAQALAYMDLPPFFPPQVICQPCSKQGWQRGEASVTVSRHGTRIGCCWGCYHEAVWACAGAWDCAVVGGCLHAQEGGATSLEVAACARRMQVGNMCAVAAPCVMYLIVQDL